MRIFKAKNALIIKGAKLLMVSLVYSLRPFMYWLQNGCTPSPPLFSIPVHSHIIYLGQDDLAGGFSKTIWLLFSKQLGNHARPK